VRLIIAGGGTGGHLFPGIAVAEEFLGRDPANQVLFVGTERGIEARAVPAAGYRLELVPAAGIRGKGFTSQIRALMMMLKGFLRSRTLIRNFRPDFVLGVGGYASLPMVLAASGMGRAAFIHEQNAIPGMTNRFLARFVDRVFVTLEESAPFFPGKKTLLTGNPLRRQILDQAAHAARSASAGSSLPQGGAGGDFRLLVFGGSQGAHAINSAMAAALPLLKAVAGRLVVTHQTGEKEAGQMEAAYRCQGIRATVTPFIHDMAEAYRQADLVICRAGATTIAEVTACGRPGILIPFPHAVDDHQRLNAEALLHKGACFMLLERELSGERLAAMILELIDNRELLQHTARLAFGMARLDAAKLICDEMLKRTAGKTIKKEG
jgi:UDP-N-acetylglucosamine--N-acetylmuramyl-(pentapeptide) pyrophosphoryl-undecaprenol N-acetylglucosamine transferase